jgi:hypothetical protein
VDAELCRAASPGTVLLAFDVLHPPESPSVPTWRLFTGDLPCAGRPLGDVFLGAQVGPAAGTWSTECVELSATHLSARVAVVALDPNAGVRNLRFVQSCACRREVKACLGGSLGSYCL